MPLQTGNHSLPVTGNTKTSRKEPMNRELGRYIEHVLPPRDVPHPRSWESGHNLLKEARLIDHFQTRPALQLNHRLNQMLAFVLPPPILHKRCS